MDSKLQQKRKKVKKLIMSNSKNTPQFINKKSSKLLDVVQQ